MSKSLIPSFVKSDKSDVSDSLMVAFFFKERWERIAYSNSLKWAILSEREKEQIPNPV